jgi:hypothetical protein
VLVPSSHDLACLVEPLAIHLDPIEPSAVHKAAGQGQPVSQDVALSVKGSKVEYSINGTVVASYDKALLVTRGKLKSTDGTYGLASRTRRMPW